MTPRVSPLIVSMAAATALIAPACGAAPHKVSPKQQAEASAACASATTRQSHPAPHRGTLRADINGNGRPDEVFVSINHSAPPRCRYQLVVRSGHRIWTALIRQRGIEGPPWPIWAQLDLPDVNVVARVGGRPLIAVTTWTGASTVFVGLFSIRHDRLARLHVPRASVPDTLAYDGAGFPVAVDCAGPRTIVASSAGQAGGRWKVQRRSYRIRDGALVQTRTQTMTVRSLSDFPREFARGQDAPSRNCAVDRSRRHF